MNQNKEIKENQENNKENLEDNHSNQNQQDNQSPEESLSAIEKDGANISKKKNKKKTKPYWHWVIKIFILAIVLSMAFGVLSELFMSGTGIIVAIIIVLLFVAVAVVFDMIAVAVLACEEAPFKAMASRKVRGAKQGLTLIKNAPKISSLCADVVGDVCGVLSGAGGATVLAFLINAQTPTIQAVLIASLVSAIIAGLTIAGKAMFKQYATKNSTKVVLFIGKFLSFFSRNKSKQKNNKK